MTTTDKLSYTLADVQVLATIMLHVRDAPSIYATQHVISYSQTGNRQVW